MQENVFAEVAAVSDAWRLFAFSCRAQWPNINGNVQKFDKLWLHQIYNSKDTKNPKYERIFKAAKEEEEVERESNGRRNTINKRIT